MKKGILFVVLTIIMCTILVGCDNKKEIQNKLIGKWALNDYVYTFNEDKTCSYNAAGTIMECTYDFTENTISILYNGYTKAFESTYTVSGDVLNIKDSDGKNTIYDKVK